jgi:hypothetical protein
VLSNAVDPGWVPTKMGGPAATGDLQMGYLTQTWLAVSTDAGATASGGYWYHRRQQEPAAQARDSAFQDQLMDRLAALTGVALLLPATATAAASPGRGQHSPAPGAFCSGVDWSAGPAIQAHALAAAAALASAPEIPESDAGQVRGTWLMLRTAPSLTGTSAQRQASSTRVRSSTREHLRSAWEADHRPARAELPRDARAGRAGVPPDAGGRPLGGRDGD